jgi:hypothetical protein
MYCAISASPSLVSNQLSFHRWPEDQPKPRRQMDWAAFGLIRRLLINGQFRDRHEGFRNDHQCEFWYWNPLQWGPNSQVDDTLFLRMKTASYRMIALFLKASGVANLNSAASWNLSNDTKTLILLNGSDSNNRTAWPRLPEMPSKPIQWMKMHPFYWSYTDNEDYKGFYVWSGNIERGGVDFYLERLGHT